MIYDYLAVRSSYQELAAQFINFPYAIHLSGKQDY